MQIEPCIHNNLINIKKKAIPEADPSLLSETSVIECSDLPDLMGYAGTESGSYPFANFLVGISSASDWINFETVWLVEFVFWDLLIEAYI